MSESEPADRGPGDEPAAVAPAWTPTFPAIRRLDYWWYQVERYVCGGMFLIMAVVVFASVVSDAFGTRREPLDLVILYGLSLLAVRTRARARGGQPRSWPVSLALAALVTVAVVAVVLGTIRILEGRSIMIQKLSLVAMIWVALLGASMATYERSHLSLELGEKLWPARVVHLVKALAHGVTAGFCLAAFRLSLDLVASQRGMGLTIDGNEWLQMWQAFVVVPYAFAAMAIRFLAQAGTVATGTAEPVEERLPS